MRAFRPSFRRTLWLALAVPLVAALSWVGVVFVKHDNFRVASAELFRSGQPHHAEWQESLASAHYRSVLNLRGARPTADWYQHELRFASDAGLEHHDFELSAEVAPTVAQMREIVDIMRRAPKPLLVHCRSGSDRTGLVAALYLLKVDGRPVDEARQQLSLWYGHFPWLGSRTVAMDRAFDQFVAADSATTASAQAQPL